MQTGICCPTNSLWRFWNNTNAKASTAYIHFKADLLQTKFSYYKRDLAKYKTEIAELIAQEREITERLLVLAGENPAIGFEASNHYFYNDRTLTEKILETYALEEKLKNV